MIMMMMMMVMMMLLLIGDDDDDDDDDNDDDDDDGDVAVTFNSFFFQYTLSPSALSFRQRNSYKYNFILKSY